MKKIIINKENPSGIALDFTTEDTEKYNVNTQEHLDRREALSNVKTEKDNLKASAKAKLMAGKPMTEEEAKLTLHL